LDRTVQDAVNGFLEELSRNDMRRTKSEIFYNSTGTKIETIDADGNRIQRYDSTSTDNALDNICSLVQDVHLPTAE
jgi:hypothetical protein